MPKMEGEPTFQDAEGAAGSFSSTYVGATLPTLQISLGEKPLRSRHREVT